MALLFLHCSQIDDWVGNNQKSQGDQLGCTMISRGTDIMFLQVFELVMSIFEKSAIDFNRN